MSLPDQEEGSVYTIDESVVTGNSQPVPNAQDQKRLACSASHDSKTPQSLATSAFFCCDDQPVMIRESV